MRGRERTHWIRRTGIPGEEKSLTAAAAEVLSPAVAASTRFGHPLFSAKTLEGRGLSPYPFERMFAHIVKPHARNHSRSMARKRLSRRIDQHQTPAPSTHTRLGIARIIIRDHTINSHSAGKPLLRRFYNAQAVFQLFTRRNQRIPILQSPTVILSVGNLQAVWLQLFRKSNHLLEVIEILAMNHQVHSERNWEPPNHLRKNNFVTMGFRSRNPVRGCVFRILK